MCNQHNSKTDHSRLDMATRESERKASLRPSLSLISVVQTMDLSNLCIEEIQPDQRIVASSPWQRCVLFENSLYPTVKELYESTDRHDLSVEDIFAQAERYRMSRIKESKMLQRESHSYASQNSRKPGAYHSSSQVQIEKPHLPAWVETAQNVREKVERQGFLSEVHQEASRRDPIHHEASRRDPIPFSQNTDRISDPPSHDLNNSSCFSEERSTTSSFSNYRRARAPPQPVEVEVAPGEFMPLRGSDETLQAIEMGYARIVTCFACCASLACVPDCELVICPDCRVISPICAEEDDRKMAHRNHSPYGCWEGKDGYYQEASPPPRGVGLGLKMR
jgi:hypothetical protein